MHFSKVPTIYSIRTHIQNSLLFKNIVRIGKLNKFINPFLKYFSCFLLVGILFNIIIYSFIVFSHGFVVFDFFIFRQIDSEFSYSCPTTIVSFPNYPVNFKIFGNTLPCAPTGLQHV